MKQVVLTAALISLLLGAAPAAEEVAPQVTVEAAGLRIVAPLKDTEEALQAFQPALPGTAIALLVKAPAGGLVKFDAKNSAVAKFTDDKGADLQARPAKEDGLNRASGNSGFGLSKLSSDGKACALEIASPLLPAKGASALKLEGVLTMLCATATKEYVQPDVPLRDGSKVTAGKLALTIKKVEKTEQKQAPLSLAFSASQELDELAEIRFYKADGIEIKASPAGKTAMGILGVLTVEWYYNLSEQADLATLKIYLWADLQKKKIPFSLSVNMGL